MRRIELPAGWLFCKVENLAELLRGISYKKDQARNASEKGYKPILRANNINGELNFDSLVYVPEELISEDQYICKDDIVFAMSSGSINLVGKSARATGDYDGSYGAFCGLVRPNNHLCKPYLYYAFQESKFKTLISQVAKGSNINNLKREHLLDFEVQLPPLNEQKRIVAKLEELFSELDNGIAALKTAREQLKIYRQSVLKHAFEGKLTAQWREDNKDKLETPEQLLARIQQEREARYLQQLEEWKQAVKELEDDGKVKWKPGKPKSPKTIVPTPASELTKLALLPATWKWVPWEELLEFGNDSFKRGPFGSALTKSIFVNAGYKVYEQYCPINDDPYFVRYYITPEKYGELQQFAVDKGDFLISCSGVTLGRITQVPEDFEEGVINQALLRVRLNRKIVLDRFFVQFFRAAYFQGKIFDKSQGAAIPNVKGVNELKAIPVPLVPLEEQGKLIELLDQYLSVLDDLETQISLSLSRAETLRQAILKKAFSGQLVPQDPNDEPASELLVRIQAEKVAAKAVAKSTPIANRKKPVAKRGRKVKEDTNA